MTGAYSWSCLQGIGTKLASKFPNEYMYTSWNTIQNLQASPLKKQSLTSDRGMFLVMSPRYRHKTGKQFSLISIYNAKAASTPMSWTQHTARRQILGRWTTNLPSFDCRKASIVGSTHNNNRVISVHFIASSQFIKYFLQTVAGSVIHFVSSASIKYSRVKSNRPMLNMTSVTKEQWRILIGALLRTRETFRCCTGRSMVTVL